MSWATMFEPSLPVLEVALRGSLIFLGLTLLLRVVGQRESGELALTDLLVIVLLATSVSHAFAPGSTSLTDALVLAVTLLFWSVLLDAVAYRFPAARAVLKPTKRPLVQDGQVNHRRMRREFLTLEELESQLRLQGIESVDDVEYAFLEPSGMISAFRKDRQQPAPTPRPPLV